MNKFLKLQALPFLLTVLGLLSPAELRGQTVSGQETTVVYTGLNVPITPPNTPAGNFAGPNGTNTFIIPLANPSVSIRFYITNNTANACTSGLSAQLFAASDPQVSSFNNSVSNWQIVPLQNTSGSLVGTLNLSLPSSTAIYFSSGAISAPKVALQLVNTSSANCSTTTFEVTGVITQIAVTVPLVSANSPQNFSGGQGQVQGVVAQQQSGALVNPIINGGLQPAINSQFAAVGLDNFNTTLAPVSTSPGTTVTLGAIPPPSVQNEVAISLAAGFTQISGPSPSILAPWSQIGSLVTADNTALIGSILNGAISGTQIKEFYQNGANPPGGGTPTSINVITLWPFGTAVRQAVNVSSGGAPAAVLAGSTLMAAIRCTGTVQCNVTLTDTLANNYVQLSNPSSTGNIPPGMIVFVATNKTSAGTPTLTATVTAGTAGTGVIAFVELTGTTTSPLVQPAVSNAADQLGGQVVRLDAQAPQQFSCSVTITTNTTTQLTGCGAPTTVGANSTPVRLYITDIQLNTTTASTTGTLQFKNGTGANCATGTTNLSAILYPNVAVGITNILGTRTPLVSPLQSALCVTQASGVAGTTTVEVRGFIAP
jgi:hypothetical protein